jgi:hypothetical protein
MNREMIYDAIFTRLQGVVGVQSVSRILRHWSDVPAEDQPAVFLAHGDEVVEPAESGASRHFLLPRVYVYANARSSDVPPSTTLNNLIGAIEDVFAPIRALRIHTDLGMPDELEWVRVEGVIETDEGTLGEQAVAIVPLRVLVAED